MKSLVDDDYFTGIYLRQMSREDARRVEELHSQIHEVRGCLGSLDVMLLPWGNCPYALKGQYQGRHKQPKIALEAANDYNLWFWHYYFGEPGSLNDINVWERSSLFKQMTNGEMQDIDFDFEINGETFNQLYWLVDSIYPRQARFLKAVDSPALRIDWEFSSWQERHRKSIERGFGVLEKKFHILVNPIQLYYLDDIEKVVGGCIVLHNMMVKVRMESDSHESEDLYQLASHEVPHYNLAAAAAAIDQEDAEFDAAPMEFCEQKKDAQILGRQLRLVQHYWKELTDVKAHHRLQDAVKRELYYRRHGSNADVDELDASYDPLGE
jgi:hypothetical protein